MGNTTPGKKENTVNQGLILHLYMDQVYQGRAIMESTGATKDAPVISVLLDEALGARRRKAMGISDYEEPPGQGKANRNSEITNWPVAKVANQKSIGNKKPTPSFDAWVWKRH